tara:strand:+ start:27604 stop:29478 length:1875 start_codon:yes stop_codon:yes gene_type:complete
MSYFLSLFVLISIATVWAQKPESSEKDYSIPVLFDFKNSAERGEYGFSYNLNKKELLLENLARINENTFTLRFISQEQVKKISERSGAGDNFLEVRVPYGLFDSFDIQLINKSGKLLLSQKIPSEKVEPKNKGKSLGQGRSFVIDDFDDAIQQILKAKEPLKLCIDQTKDKFFTRLCSRNFGFIGKNKKYKVKFDRNRYSNVRALIDNESAPLKNRIIAKDNIPVRAFFELQNGIVFEMVNQPKSIELAEVVQDGVNYTFLGVGNSPFGAIKKESEAVNFFNNIIAFDSTIGDFREFYSLNVSNSTTRPVIVTEGLSGGLFQYFLTLTNVPTEAERIYLLNNTPNATYLDNFKLHATSNKNLKFDAQNKVTKERNSNRFVWNSSLDKKGEFNSASLEYENQDGGKNRAYFEVYRGFSQEFSLKLTGIKTETQFVTLGEVSYNKWFEDFGTRPGSWFFQRLGIGFNYFKSLTDIETGEGGKSSLQSQSLSLKYRLTPGLWNWDESLGVIFSYQRIKFETMDTPLVGVGVFWARSMPLAFDAVFNLVPIFRYPKWVDMDFVYLPASLDTKIKSNGSMALNFHGKVLWTKKMYGEAGFGYKAFNLENEFVGSEVRSLYLTVGLGLNF